MELLLSALWIVQLRPIQEIKSELRDVLTTQSIRQMDEVTRLQNSLLSVCLGSSSITTDTEEKIKVSLEDSSFLAIPTVTRPSDCAVAGAAEGV